MAGEFEKMSRIIALTVRAWLQPSAIVLAASGRKGEDAF